MGRGETDRAVDDVTRFVALLRGVNVGGANRLPMAALKEMFAAAGAQQVETLIQSGNVVFQSHDNNGITIAVAVQAEIERAFHFRTAIVVRDADRWRAVVAGNPFLTSGEDPDALHIACLSTIPGASALARLDRNRSPPDEFVVAGAEIYLKLPNGTARTKLTNAWFDATLAVVSTMRNWRTAQRLSEMLAAIRE